MKLNPEAIDLAIVRRLWSGTEARLDDASMERVAASAAAVDRIVAGGETVYGINTGFGMLANTRIPAERLAELQTNLILSHSAGLGDPLPRHVTRLMIILKLLGLGRGHSGVRPLVVEALQRLVDADAMPLIPSQGSVGASGDLAPLAHLISALMGYGRIDLAGEIIGAAAALDRLGLVPLQLGPKEGLALINGTQASTALALDALFLGERVFAAAIAAGAMSVDALKGSAKPFDPRISALRGQPGQIRVAKAIAGLLDGSEIMTSHIACSRVQDPYSFRCQPQVMGASLDLLQNAARTLTIEAGAVTDNPIVFADDDSAISGGNFHAQPVAFAADTIAIALCEVGSMSERRVSVLVDPKMSGLPAFLTADSGVNSGLMIPQVTAAALVSENKSLAFPISVDSIPTSAGQEDHVSMAPIAARKAAQIARNAAGVVAVVLFG
jgi:histidine ammonia-lyase